MFSFRKPVPESGEEELLEDIPFPEEDSMEVSCGVGNSFKDVARFS